MKTNEPVRVVMAEDESLVANLLQDELESVGMKVVGRATDGRRAVELVRCFHPDVVLMDISMPDMDGIAAAKVIQSECPTPVVIVTAHKDVEEVARATEAGVGAFIVKPSQAEELERAITIAIARHADLTTLRQVNQELQRALAEVRTLKGILPICCSCKKIRDDRNYWDQVEVYVMKHTDAKFSHGYCPECLEKYFPGVDLSEIAGMH